MDSIELSSYSPVLGSIDSMKPACNEEKVKAVWQLCYLEEGQTRTSQTVKYITPCTVENNYLFNALERQALKPDKAISVRNIREKEREYAESLYSCAMVYINLFKDGGRPSSIDPHSYQIINQTLVILESYRNPYITQTLLMTLLSGEMGNIREGRYHYMSMHSCSILLEMVHRLNVPKNSCSLNIFDSTVFTNSVCLVAISQLFLDNLIGRQLDLLILDPKTVVQQLMRQYKLMCDQYQGNRLKRLLLHHVSEEGNPEFNRIDQLCHSLLLNEGYVIGEVLQRVRNYHHYLTENQDAPFSDNEPYLPRCLSALYLLSCRAINDGCSTNEFNAILEVYEIFQMTTCEDQANLLKVSVLANLSETREDWQKAIALYEVMLNELPQETPVYDPLLHCLEQCGRYDRMHEVCLQAMTFFQKANIPIKVQYFERKAFWILTLKKSYENQLSPTVGQTGVIPSQPLDQSPKTHKTPEDIDQLLIFLGEKPTPAQASVRPKSKKKKKRLHANTTQDLSPAKLKDVDQATKLKPAAVHLSHSSAEVICIGESRKSPPPITKVITPVMGLTNSRTSGDYSVVKSARHHFQDLQDINNDISLFLGKQRKKEAQQQARQAIKAYPKDSWLQHSAGWTFYLTDNLVHAKQCFFHGLSECLYEYKDILPILNQWKQKPRARNFMDLSTAIIKLNITTSSETALHVSAFLRSLAHVLDKENDSDNSKCLRDLSKRLNPEREKKKKSPHTFNQKVEIVSQQLFSALKESIYDGQHDFKGKLLSQ